MITGCYVLHVYCDALTHDSPNEYCPAMQEFIGETVKEARQAAKTDGWQVLGAHAWCPKHAGRSFKSRKCDREARSQREKDDSLLLAEMDTATDEVHLQLEEQIDEHRLALNHVHR